LDWHGWAACADDDGVVVDVDDEPAAALGAAVAAVVVDVVESAAAAGAAVVVSVVPVVPVFWALTEFRGRIVRAAIAPPVVAAVAMAATNALFLMGPRFDEGGQMALGESSDGAPNS